MGTKKIALTMLFNLHRLNTFLSKEETADFWAMPKETVNTINIADETHLTERIKCECSKTDDNVELLFMPNSSHYITKGEDLI